MKMSLNMANAMMGRIPPSTFADGTCHIIPAFGNVSVFETEEGLIIFDTPIKPLVRQTFQKLRDITDKQVKLFIAMDILIMLMVLDQS